MKKLPQRTCTGCKIKKDKKDLIRIVKNKNNEIFVDDTGKKDGRGIYICKDINCLEKAIKAKRISRAFETEISENIYDELRKKINGGEVIG